MARDEMQWDVNNLAICADTLCPQVSQNCLATCQAKPKTLHEAPNWDCTKPTQPNYKRLPVIMAPNYCHKKLNTYMFMFWKLDLV